MLKNAWAYTTSFNSDFILNKLGYMLKKIFNICWLMIIKRDNAESIEYLQIFWQFMSQSEVDIEVKIRLEI